MERDPLQPILRRHSIHGFSLNRELYAAARLRDWAVLLDLGCGAGDFLLEAREHRHHQGLLVALDRRAAPLADLREAAVRRGLTLETVQADVQCLPWEDECFDGVFLRHRLSPAGALEEMLREVRRVVRPAGRVVVLTRSRFNLRVSQEFRRRLALEFDELPHPHGVPPLVIENATELLGRVFGPVAFQLLDDALHFRRLEDYLRFFDTLRYRYDPVPDPALWQRALSRVADWAVAWFEARHAISEPRSHGIFVGTVL
jgi:SAM-dependent methyltransferase